MLTILQAQLPLILLYSMGISNILATPGFSTFWTIQQSHFLVEQLLGRISTYTQIVIYSRSVKSVLRFELHVSFP
jgi:hypothetical protein